MAKRKPKPALPAGRQPPKPLRAGTANQVQTLADVMLQRIAENQQGLNPGTYVGEANESVVIGVEFPDFSRRWLFHNSGYAVGRMGVIIGETGSFKTAMQADLMGLHLSVHGSLVKYNETESRDSATFRKSIVGDDKFPLVVREKCETIEEWQKATTDPLLWLRKLHERGDGPAQIMVLCVDSLTGVASKHTADAIEENGHASMTHAIDANLINQYLKWVPGKVDDWPISFIVTNHVKFSMEKRGPIMARVMRIPGGDAIRYHSTYIMLMKGGSKPLTRQDVDGGYPIRVEMFKNSLGERSKELEVDFCWWYTEDPATGVKDKQVSRWDWHGASVKLLQEHLTKDAEKHPGLADVVQFPQYHANVYKCSCPQVGITKPAPYHEVGAAIAADAGLMERLQGFYGIHKITPFRAGVPWRRQIREAIAAGEQRRLQAPTAAPVGELG